MDSIPIQTRIKNKFYELFSADLRSLALFRIGLALLIIADLINRSHSLISHYSDHGVLPRAFAIERYSSEWIYSLYLISGSAYILAILFIIAGLIAISLLVGYKTKLATFLSWLFLVSIQARIPLIIQGGDEFFRLLLFWGMFLPLGACYSVDSALNKKQELLPKSILSAATIALYFQIAFVYLFTVWMKSGGEWRTEYTAVYYALSLEQFSTQIGHYLLNYHHLLIVLTFLVFWFEFIGPFLLFCPIFTGPIRTLIVFGFIGLQFGLGSCMELGLFPWISSFAMFCFLPNWFWDKLKFFFKPNQSSKIIIYYDHECSFCKKIVYLIRTFLCIHNTEIQSISNDEQMHSLMHLNNSWIVKNAQHEVFYKMDAFIILLNHSALFFWLAKVFKWSPLYNFGSKTYKQISKYRKSLSIKLDFLHFHSYQIKTSHLTNLLVIFLLIFVFFINLSTIKSIKHISGTQPSWAGKYQVYPETHLVYKVPKSLEWLRSVLFLHQGWAMFAPRPALRTEWYVIPAQLANGETIDLYSGGKPVSWDKPKLISSTYQDSRWRKYLANIPKDSFEQFRVPYADYLCYHWNKSHKDDKRAVSLEIFLMGIWNEPDYKKSEVKKRSLIKHNCNDETKENKESQKQLIPKLLLP